MCCLNPKSFITTNFDDLLEKAAIKQCLPFKSIACDSDVSNIHGDRYILKLHGDLEHKNIVLKEEDYLNYSEKFKLIETLLKSIFSMNTVVFIGYGLNDNNIKLILNWTKNLLNDSFNKPIFIYTDDEELDDYDMLYLKSRGLEVIDYRTCCNNPDGAKGDFSERYNCVLKKIISYDEISFEDKSKYESFELLYNLIKPLNSFKALRIQDIRDKLGKYMYIDEMGVILYEQSSNIMTLYLEIKNKVSTDIEDPIQSKFNVIDSVFAKARIQAIVDKKYNVLSEFKLDAFSDINCISFNYMKMHKIVKINPNNIYKKYNKAYYLSKLMKYDDALELFTDVAIQSYKDKDYLLCYFSKINRRNLSIVIKNVNESWFYNNIYNFNKKQKFDLEQIKKESIFENLPAEFKEEYDSFSNLYTTNFLYNNVYNTFIENEKMRKTINKNTIEYGITATDKAISRLNNNLHFIMGNKLFLDKFIEFKVTIKNTMELLVTKYAVSNQRIIGNEYLMENRNTIIGFDEVDVFCFIEFFEDNEISDIMKKNNIKEIPLSNIDAVNTSIHNLFEYYDLILSKSTNRLEISSYEVKIKNCVCLLRYITVSPKTIEYVCNILLKYNFEDIYIDDKILFIDNQMGTHKIEPKRLQKIINNTLLKYIYENIECISKGKHFELSSTRRNMEYWDLANYLTFDNTKYISKGVSTRIEYIITNQVDISLVSMFKCRDIIYKKTKVKLDKYMYERLCENFDFNLFGDLLTIGICFDKSVIKKLIRYLESTIENARKCNNSVRYFPYHDPYTDLINVGFWCTLGYLERKDFIQFVGIVDKFDFCFDPDKFDYNKFDISWLLNLNEIAYETIFKNQKSKEKIRVLLKDFLKNNDIEEKDKQKLYRILVEYAI